LDRSGLKPALHEACAQETASVCGKRGRNQHPPLHRAHHGIGDKADKRGKGDGKGGDRGHLLGVEAHEDQERRDQPAGPHAKQAGEKSCRGPDDRRAHDRTVFAVSIGVFPAPIKEEQGAGF